MTNPLHTPQPAPWSDLPDHARRAAVLAYLEAGLTTDEIADELGVTVNALRGWSWRSGIRMTNRRASRPPEIPAPQEDQSVWIPKWPVVGIMELGRHHCRWPVGAAEDKTFCGARKTKGSYCAEHAAIAYRPKIGETEYMPAGGSNSTPMVSADEARMLLGLKFKEGVE